ncbi:orotate phosphoribosyltransferase [Rhodocista pekingensis]|uniref:Orotate phosphoribosyltransferase n=1 Tax=Rhodocista pekingensis TaxID=201185 RepID=A0ABW2KRP6_9PROT
MVPDYADMELRKEAMATARLLLDCGAVRFDTGTTFRIGDGVESPLHVDARRVLAWPGPRNRLIDLAVEAIERDVGGDGLDAIAACTEGQGVPFATLIADRLDLPLLFVRRGPSDDPHKSVVESRVEPGWRVMLVEQLATDGHRKARLIAPLQEAGANVQELFVLFQYGVFDRIHENLSPLGVRLHALATWWDLLEVAREGAYLPQDALDEIDRFLKNPDRWCPSCRRVEEDDGA